MSHIRGATPVPAAAMTLHEQPTEELKRQLADGLLGPKKAAVAEATLRRRRSERIQDWLQRHPWLSAMAAALGLAGLFVRSSNRPSKGGGDNDG